MKLSAVEQQRSPSNDLKRKVARAQADEAETTETTATEVIRNTKPGLPTNTDELKFIQQLLGLHFRKNDLITKNDERTSQFCASWSPQLRATYRECIDKILYSISHSKTQLAQQNTTVLQQHLINSWEDDHGTFQFMDNMGSQRFSIIIDMCGMIAMEMKLKACLKPGFSSLSSVPTNISAESNAYLKSITTKLT